jgi:hypothetical protein
MARQSKLIGAPLYYLDRGKLFDRQSRRAAAPAESADGR